jgi:predicted NAD/FAD-dependent oxidoreductase
MRIAIQGSGVAAAACAERLSKRHDVTVFESGRGPGGRMSTRRADGYQWDHGAQYFSPKTDEFAAAIGQWEAGGLCDAWNGAHCVWANDGVTLDPKAETTVRYVGKPGMNDICKGLLEGINTRYKTRAVAKRRAGSVGGWTLQHGKSGASLGEFDFLICSDKMAAMQHRNDLDRKLLSGFVQPANVVRSLPSLALLVATDATNLGFDSLELSDHPIFSWLARDSSKPGRTRTDGVECWVAHASADFTKSWLKKMKKGGRGGPNNIRTAVVRDLVPKLQALFSELGGDNALGNASPGEILFAQGHRWGAAFPTASFNSGNATDQFYLDEANAFAACGDYFTAFPGRVEGGWVSGTSLADALL